VEKIYSERRWFASALFDIENRMRKVNNHIILSLICNRIKYELKIENKEEG
jgi:hypothetical protein